MQVKIVSIAGPVLKIQTEGKIGRNDRAGDQEPIQNLLGHEVYCRKVLLSLENSDLIDSLGVAWLLQCHKRFRDAGGTLVIHSVPPMIMHVLHVMRLEKVLRIAPDEASAEAQAIGDTHGEHPPDQC
ncbi:MAG: STAS domain-containing protein [Pirellulales bacterium]